MRLTTHPSDDGTDSSQSQSQISRRSGRQGGVGLPKAKKQLVTGLKMNDRAALPGPCFDAMF